MHSVLQHLSQKLNVPIVERDALETWAFDGQNIANHWMDPPYQGTPPWSEDYPGARIDYTTAELLHELAHYFAAAPEQRDLPEYGLAMGIAKGSGYGPNGGEFRDAEGRLRGYSTAMSALMGLVDHYESEVQERLTWLLTIYWGKKYNIPCDFSDWKVPFSWDDYYQFKFQFNNGSPWHYCDQYQHAWEALIRFRNLLPQLEALGEGL